MNLVGVGGRDFTSFGTFPFGFAPGWIGSGSMTFNPDSVFQGNLGAYGGADIEMNARSDVRTHPIGMRPHEIYRNLASAPSPP